MFYLDDSFHSFVVYSFLLGLILLPGLPIFQPWLVISPFFVASGNLKKTLNRALVALALHFSTLLVCLIREMGSSGTLCYLLTFMPFIFLHFSKLSNCSF